MREHNGIYEIMRTAAELILRDELEKAVRETEKIANETLNLYGRCCRIEFNLIIEDLPAGKDCSGKWEPEILADQDYKEKKE